MQGCLWWKPCIGKNTFCGDHLCMREGRRGGREGGREGGRWGGGRVESTHSRANKVGTPQNYRAGIGDGRWEGGKKSPHNLR